MLRKRRNLAYKHFRAILYNLHVNTFFSAAQICPIKKTPGAFSANKYKKALAMEIARTSHPSAIFSSPPTLLINAEPR